MRIESRAEEWVAGDREHRRREPGDEGQRQQWQDAHPHREARPMMRSVALPRGQPLDEDRDEDRVVDAEHDLEDA